MSAQVFDWRVVASSGIGQESKLKAHCIALPADRSRLSESWREQSNIRQMEVLQQIDAKHSDIEMKEEVHL